MSDIRVFYSETQRVVLIGGSNEFASGSGALLAEVDSEDPNKVVVTYPDLETQDNNVKQPLRIRYDKILDEAGSPAGANITEVVDYLNDEFAKGPDYQLISSPSDALTQEDIDINPQTKFSETLTLVGGAYEIKLSFVAWCTATNRLVEAYLEIDDVEIDPRFTKEPKDIRDRNWASRTFVVQLSKGDHKFEFLYGRTGGTGGAFAAVSDVVLIVERVGPDLSGFRNV